MQPLSHYIHAYLQPKSIAVVEICEKAETESRLTYQVLQGHVHKKEVQVDKEYMLEDIEQLHQKLTLEKQKNIIVVLNTPKVLERLLPTEDKKKPAVLMQEAFPQIEAKEFIYQTHTYKGDAFLSLARRSYIEDILEDFTQKYFLHALYLGNLPLFSLLPYFETTQRKFTHQGKQLDATSTTISYTRTAPVQSDKKVSIGDKWMEESSLNVLAAALDFYASAPAQVSYNPIENSEENYRYYTLIQKVLYPALAVLLAILLFNTYFYVKYQGEMREKGIVLNEQIEDAENQKILQQQIQQKREMQSHLSLSTSRNTPILDSLAYSLPTTISWNKLALHPLQNELNARDSLRFAHNTLSIEGVTKEVSALVDWTKRLQTQYHFVQDVSIEHLEEQDSLTHFELNIALR